MINEKYIIKKELGEGRSKVFLCEDVDFPGRNIAIKILPDNAPVEEIESFRNEFFTLRRLNHPNIIKTNEYGTIVRNNTPGSEIKTGSKFITLEYFEGAELSSSNFKNENELRKIIAQLCSVLYYLHQSNFIYYDLKPENILVSNDEEDCIIKLIDLGLARYTFDEREFAARGTAEYIAPEILKNEPHDHRVDLYSLGMLLYKIAYNKFPFDLTEQIDIYKAHLEGGFDFPASSYSDELINVIKKLLSREKDKRYFTTLQVLGDLNINLEDYKRDWVPSKTFTNRKDALAVIHSFINKQTDGEVLTIRGVEESGKSFLLDEVYAKYEKTILIRNTRFGLNKSFWQVLLREIIFSDHIYPNLNGEILKAAFDLLQQQPEDLLDSLKKILLNIVKENKFILLLDEYNRFDDFSLEVLRNIIPVFQVNNIRLILSEDSAYPYLTESISNLSVVNLAPFTEAHLIEHIDKSLASFFPKEEIKKIIMMYADLLPGSIDAFLRDIVLLNVLQFTPEGPVIFGKDEELDLLKSSQNEIYKLRLRELNDDEYETARILSLFEIIIDSKSLTSLTGKSENEIQSVIESLREKNILVPENISANPEFTSEGLKKYLYNNIESKTEFHLKAAEAIDKNIPSFSRVELARQFELAGLFYRSFEVMKEEIAAAEKVSALSYKKKLLTHLLEFPLVEKDLNDINYELAGTLFKLGDKKSALDIIEKLLKTKLSNEDEVELLVIKGNCLLSTGEPAEGITILKEILPSIKTEKRKQDILFDIASAEFDLNNYAQANEISKGIIRNVNASAETRGKAFNLIGLIQIYEKGNMDGAISNFEEALDVYQKAGLLLNVAGMEVNLGNIYNMKGDSAQAELHWNKAMQINLSIGNLEQEAKLLLNYGIYYYDKLDFETAIEQYTRANHILSSLGDKNGEGLVQVNLGEVNLTVCDYQNAFNSLRRARKIFSDLKNYEEEAEVIFITARLYFIIGANELLAETLADYKKMLDQNILTEKHNINYELLRMMRLFAEHNFTELPEKLREMREYFSEADDRNKFLIAAFLLCETQINLENYEDALIDLNDEKFVDICNQNDLLAAERNFYLGKITEKLPRENLESPIEYYLKAYELIEDVSITELTWKILYSITMYYRSRGNSGKASEYSIYAKSIIEFVAENIKDAALHNHYISKPERKTALEDLTDEEAEIQK